MPVPRWTYSLTLTETRHTKVVRLAERQQRAPTTIVRRMVEEAIDSALETEDEAKE